MVTNAVFGGNQMLIVHYRRWLVCTFRIYQLHGKTWQGKLFILLIISTEYCIISVYPFEDICFDGNVCIIQWINLESTLCLSVDYINHVTLIKHLLMGNNIRLNGQQRSFLWVQYFQVLMKLFMAERWKDWCLISVVLLQLCCNHVYHVEFII